LARERGLIEEQYRLEAERKKQEMRDLQAINAQNVMVASNKRNLVDLPSADGP